MECNIKRNDVVHRCKICNKQLKHEFEGVIINSQTLEFFCSDKCKELNYILKDIRDLNMEVYDTHRKQLKTLEIKTESLDKTVVYLIILIIFFIILCMIFFVKINS